MTARIATRLISFLFCGVVACSSGGGDGSTGGSGGSQSMGQGGSQGGKATAGSGGGSSTGGAGGSQGGSATAGVGGASGSSGGSAGSASTACNVVYDCPTGQTCVTSDGTTFVCLPDGAGKAGDVCDANLSAPVTCGDQLGCIVLTGPLTSGFCAAWCDSTHPCPTGKTCTAALSTQGVPVSFCL
jgi:hypothetical protein